MFGITETESAAKRFSFSSVKPFLMIEPEKSTIFVAKLPIPFTQPPDEEPESEAHITNTSGHLVEALSSNTSCIHTEILGNFPVECGFRQNDLNDDGFSRNEGETFLGVLRSFR